MIYLQVDAIILDACKIMIGNPRQPHRHSCNATRGGANTNPSQSSGINEAHAGI